MRGGKKRRWKGETDRERERERVDEGVRRRCE